MRVKLLTNYHVDFLSLKRGCIGLSESMHVKMPHCWKSHVTAQILLTENICNIFELKESFDILLDCNPFIHTLLQYGFGYNTVMLWLPILFTLGFH